MCEIYHRQELQVNHHAPLYARSKASSTAHRHAARLCDWRRYTVLSVRFESICKDFGPVRVLHEVGFAIQKRQIHALIGENGAGKSTLMKILGGYLQPSAGQVLVDGQAVHFRSSREAEAAGIVLIHQEFNLAEDLSIAQNVFLGRELRRGLLLDQSAMNRQTTRALEQVGLWLDPRRKVSSLIVAEKQLVEIAKALSRQAKLLIMDEPTATLTPGEIETLFKLIARMKGEGVTILYISHKLEEVKALSDTVTVLRDGRHIQTAPTATLTQQEMANLMVGRELSDMFPLKMAFSSPKVVFAAQGVSVPGWATEVSFELHQGEILGFAGLVGAGRTELFEGILGLRPRSSGRFELNRKTIELHSPAQALRQGLVYLSEDRKGKGLHVNMELRPNLTLMALQLYAHPLLDTSAEGRAFDKEAQHFNIRGGQPESKASALSGGNQQKLALAKILHPDPKIVILDEPTRGVDVGAKREIYFLIQQLAQEGRSVIVISSELLELIGLCHRLVVMRGGHVTGILGQEQMSEAEIIAYATGIKGSYATA